MSAVSPLSLIPRNTQGSESMVIIGAKVILSLVPEFTRTSGFTWRLISRPHVGLVSCKSADPGFVISLDRKQKLSSLDIIVPRPPDSWLGPQETDTCW